MKILIINKFLHANGGSETYIFELGRQFEEDGHDVQYFGMEHPDRKASNHLNMYTSNMEFHGGGLSKLLYPFKIIYSKEAYQKLLLILKDFEPDVVHINNFNFQLTPSILYAVKKYKKLTNKRVPVIMTAHDSQLVCPDHLMKIPSDGRLCFDCQGKRFFHCVKNKCIHNSRGKSILAAVEAYLYHFLKTYKMLDKIICPSDFLNARLSADPILAERTITLHNFVASENNRKGQAVKKEYVVYFGRYSEEKGMKMLLEICRSLPEIPFVFAGGGPFKDEVAKIENVEDLGFLSGDRLRNVVEQAKFCLFPSQVHENCSFTVIESQIYGTPVLASRLGGTPELITDGVTGELIEASETELWIKKISDLWQNDEKCRKYAENCLKVQFYTVKQYCDILYKLYQSFTINGNGDAGKT